MSDIFKTGEYLNKEFIMQLPYLYDNGSPRCIDVMPYDAYKLVKSDVCRFIHADQHICILIPKIPAAQNVVFQLGEDPV